MRPLYILIKLPGLEPDSIPAVKVCTHAAHLLGVRLVGLDFSQFDHPLFPEALKALHRLHPVQPPAHPVHQYWYAGDPGCPPDVKAANGELHTLRCKHCGADNPRDNICIPSQSVVHPEDLTQG